ncbi:sugar ABC transporter substrate-binding protein [Rhizobium laguerreae]|uniref:substrate-binding domain-containing protein n=1 Tax=Rhizobium laguerreae TaxID=1076926 RepID=UPI001C92636D|nr:substrate-binding domain-containing protein [Rhizobium laguerreae]MBY3258714.1 sugar ABC transporter substrate-binding protein [Rhizobium laguerreae]MBY3286551.1 sugar ABC transporter substrate-binding protein [Rhizobium laguerreae]MBY3293214.1 sugar ABC transporter substrate-binding protein [Rhizobium laguerreae]
METDKIRHQSPSSAFAVASFAGALALAGLTPVYSADALACLITRTDTNPFSVRIREAANAEANKRGIVLRSYSGKIDGDSESQVEAIESCIADGAKGILIDASDPNGIVPSVKKARDAGLLVVAIETPLYPADAADATFASDNLRAGKILGEWVRQRLGNGADQAKVGFLDLKTKTAVEGMSDQGFMLGVGIDPKDPNTVGDERDSRIVGHDVTSADEEGGRVAMRNLLQKESNIDVVHSDNGPVAYGAYLALKELGKADDIMIVSAGGCSGVDAAAAGAVEATLMANPNALGALGIKAIERFANTGEKPSPSESKSFKDIGGFLVARGATQEDQDINPVCELDPTACAYQPITIERAQTICRN